MPRHDDDKLPQKKDEWGNTFRTFDLKPLQIKRIPCDCLDHTIMGFQVEMDVMAVTGVEAFLLMSRGEEIPTKREFVTMMQVLSSHN